jgi:hypothetical protein
VVQRAASADNSSASQAIPQMLRNPNVHYPTDSSRSLFTVLVQLSPIHNFPSCVLNIHINIIMPPKPRSSKLWGTFLFPYQNSVFILVLPIHLHKPTHLLLILLIAQPYLVRSTNHGAPHYTIFRTSCYFLRLRAKYPPQHPIFENSKLMFFPQRERLSFTSK